MKQLHHTQLTIMKSLLFVPSMKFAPLQQQLGVASNHLTFHLSALIDAWRCEKDDDCYLLTRTWKEYANTMDTDEYSVKKQAKLWVMICATREELDGSRSVLVQTRTKQPFWGKQWFVTGKIHRWESPLTTARRELYEETWLVWVATLIKMLHYYEFDYETQQLLADKFLFLCHIHNPEWSIVNNKEWQATRVHESELSTVVTNPYKSVEDFMQLYHAVKIFDGTVDFTEQSQYTADF